MKSSNRIRIERLEKVMNINHKNRIAKIVCNNPKDFDFSTIEADHILIYPDNGRRNHCDTLSQGFYSVSFR